MITYLNDRDWLLRYAFFESIVDVAACAGGRSLEEYILPLMVQALSGMFCSDLELLKRLLIFAKRCGRVGCCQGSCGSHKSLRVGSLPEDADMGVDERNSGIPLSSKYLDTTRFVICVRLGILDIDKKVELLAAAAFITTAAEHLPPSDIWCILYPSLRHFLKSDVVKIDEQSILAAMKRPVSCFSYLKSLSSSFLFYFSCQDKSWMRPFNGR
jgi:phosphoinositide-3-kinase regulatory subunit 4